MTKIPVLSISKTALVFSLSLSLAFNGFCLPGRSLAETVPLPSKVKEVAKKRLQNYKDSINFHIKEVINEMGKGDASKEYVVDLFLGYSKYIDSDSGCSQWKLLKDKGVDLEGSDMWGWLEDYDLSERIVSGNAVMVHSDSYNTFIRDKDAAQAEFLNKFQEETEQYTGSNGKFYWMQKAPKEINRSKPSVEWLKPSASLAYGYYLGQLIPQGAGFYRHWMTVDSGANYEFLRLQYGVLTWDKMSKSPYPLDGIGQGVARRLLAATKARNNKVTDAFRKYLQAAQAFFDQKLTVDLESKTDEQVIQFLNEQVYPIAKNGVSFAYKIHARVRPFQIKVAQAYSDRNSKIYDAWAKYYDGHYNEWIKVNNSSGEAFFAPPNSYQTVNRQAPFERKDWNFYAFTQQVIGYHHSWQYPEKCDSEVEIVDPPASERTGANLFTPLGSESLAELRGEYNLGAIEQSARIQIEKNYHPGGPCRPNENWLRRLVKAYVSHYTVANDSFQVADKSIRALAGEINKVLADYRDLFLYLEPAKVINPVRYENYQPSPPRSDRPNGDNGVADDKPDYTQIEHPEGNYSVYMGMDDFKDKLNHPPIVKGKVTRSGNTITLDASGSTDPDNDKLYYRWIVNKIPETQEAKSKEYVLFGGIEGNSGKNNTLSGLNFSPAHKVVTFTPDLSGKWEVILEVNDGREWDVAVLEAAVERHILWIQHSNGPYDEKTGLGISLELYDPKAQPGTPLHPEQSVTKPDWIWGGPYYLEVAHEKSGVYLNFNDAGKPCDPDAAYVAPSNAYCFELSVMLFGRWSNYNGKYGSSDLETDIINSRGFISSDKYHPKPGPFTLRSAFAYPEPQDIYINVRDPQITDLVYPTDNCLFGGHRLRIENMRLTATYKIAQQINHKAWINYDGKGFKEIDANSDLILSSLPVVPDWLERRAAETLNKFSEVLPYVCRILVETNPKKGGHYRPGSKSIFITEEWCSRYNLPTASTYGFKNNAFLDSLARHEAYHSYYYWTVLNQPTAIYLDTDDDGFPEYKQDQPMTFTFKDERSGKITILPIFDYLWDSPRNKFGGFGPHLASYLRGYDYIDYYTGDDDGYNIREACFKFFTYRTKNFDISLGCFSNDNPLIILLPEGLSVGSVYISNFYLLFSKGIGEDKVYKALELKAGQHYRYSRNPLKQHTKQAELKIIIHRNLHDVLARDIAGLQDYSFEECFLNYEVYLPYPARESDASRIEPGEYTGLWN